MQPKPDIRAAFFDIDGTLVSFKTHLVPATTVRALDLLRARGVKVFVASGRPKCAINNLGDLRFDGYITVNGGVTILDGKVIDEHPIQPADVANMTRLCAERDIACALALRDGLLMNFFNPKTREIFNLLNFPLPPIRPFGTLGDESVFQMIAFFGEDEEADIMPHLPGCSAQRWHPLFTDIVPAGVSKVTGIEAAEKALGITPEQVMAFGDGGNDVAMLRHAHYSVAMGNAEDSTKKAARLHTASVDDDGIWKIVSEFFG